MSNINEIAMVELKQSQYWTTQTKVTGKTIQGLICPICGDKSAWAYAPGSGSGPMAICCNKKNTCGAVTKTIELLDITFDIEKEYAPTKTDKHRPARAYLESRGIKQALQDLPIEYWPKVRKTQSGAVMFPVNSPEGQTVYNGRLINPKEGNGKTHNSASTTGCWWSHPGIEYDPTRKTFVTEAIIDSLSLIEIGHQSISVLAAGQDPSKVSLPPIGQLVFAFDADNAGTAATRKWLAAYPDAESIMPDKGQDWNDLLRSAESEKVQSIFNENYERYKINAKLALAESAREYANIYYQFHQKAPGIFVLNESTFFSQIKKKGDDIQLLVERLGRFTLQVLSFLKDSSIPDRPEYAYHLKITPIGKQPVESIATGKDLATPRGLKEFFLGRSGVAFEGGTQAATALTTLITSASVPLVSQLSLTGHDLNSDWYIFKHFAVDKTGRIHRPDKQGFFKINHQTWYRAATHAGEKAICPAEKVLVVSKLHNLITSAWGDNGAAAFAFMVGSWFVNHIKEELNWFPFLSVYGAPGSGKSALVSLLNLCQGHDTEGLPMTSLNSKKGLARSISRVSGMFTALLEDNRRDQSNFDYSVILTGFNQGPLQIQAAYSGDNRTTEAPFLGTLLFCQNNEPFTTPAERERVISLKFDLEDLNNNTRAAYEKLSKIPKQTVSRLILEILSIRNEFEQRWSKEYENAISDLAEVENRRILQNHALILALHRLVCQLFRIEYDLTAFMFQTANRKVVTAKERVPDVADYFFQAVDLLEDEKVKSCYHIDPVKKLLYINLPGIDEQLRYKGSSCFVNSALIESLTKHPGFIKSSHNFRFPDDPNKGPDGRSRVRRVWVFNTEKFKG